MPEKSDGSEKLKGALAYFLLFISGIVFLLVEKKSAFVRFHAMQSTIFFGACFLLYIVLGIVPIIGWLIAVLVSPLLTIACFVLWIFLMYKAYSGEKYKLPYIGDLAEKQLAKIK